MPRPVEISALEDGSMVLEAPALMRRFKIRLKGLVPSRDLVTQQLDPKLGRQYYIVNTDPSDPGHGTHMGPYYFMYWEALGDMLDLWQPIERPLVKHIKDRQGQVIKQVPLPAALRFEPISRILLDARLNAYNKHLVRTAREASTHGYCLVSNAYAEQLRKAGIPIFVGARHVGAVPVNEVVQPVLGPIEPEHIDYLNQGVTGPFGLPTGPSGPPTGPVGPVGPTWDAVTAPVTVPKATEEEIEWALKNILGKGEN